MYNIERPQMPNLPSLSELYWAPIEHIVSLPATVINNVYQGDILMATGKTFIKIYVRPETANFKETPINKKGVFSYMPELTGVLPKDRPELAAQLFSMRGRKGILVYKDLNGYYKVVGTLESPVRFQHSLDLGALPNRQNQSEFKFYSLGSTEPCYFYNGVLSIGDDTIINNFDIYRLVFKFDWLSLDTQDVLIDAEASGTYTLVEKTQNISTNQIYIDKGSGFVLSSSPYILDANDVLRLKITRINYDLEAMLTLR